MIHEELRPNFSKEVEGGEAGHDAEGTAEGSALVGSVQTGFFDSQNALNEAVDDLLAG